MVELAVTAGAALWLGVLTSISPCPLATNIAAVSYIGRGVGSRGRVAWTGVLYAAGRMAAYVALGALIVGALLRAPAVSHALQKYMVRALGPFLLVAGVVLLEVLPLRLPKLAPGAATGERLARRGAAGGALLGFLFALAFCPVSAALFFGSLLPLALEARSSVLVPAIYGFGTALPVIAVAGVLAGGAESIGRHFDRLAAIERWARRMTAIVFLAVGAWFTLKYTLHIEGI